MGVKIISGDVVSADISGNQNNEVETELQELSRGLTHLIFRNVRLVEEIHAMQMPIDDEIMKMLNIEINNRIYTLLATWIYGKEEERAELLRHIRFNSFYGCGTWDKARKVEI